VPVYALGDQVPVIDESAFVHPDAVVIGAVEIGAESSVWPAAVLRGDGNRIVIGARTSIQDGTVVHTTPEQPTLIGDDCVIGHLVHLEGCTIESGALIASGSIILHRVVVRTGAVVGANAVVLNGTEVPSGALAVGTPAVVKPGKARAEEIAEGVANYIEKAQRFRRELRRLE
jgi:carbonic anhydrase/acetyltransferase-like protein (isoleucine patch superfamily)